MKIFTHHPYRKKYYLTHPIDFFAHYWRDLKCAYERATKGYCFRDLWSIDDWFLNVFPIMLQDFNKIRNGHPGNITEEEWNTIIEDMIISFKNADEEQTDYLNKYEEEYDKIIFKGDNNYTDKEKELQKNYYNEENKKFEYRKHNLQKGFQLLNKWFFALWD